VSAHARSVDDQRLLKEAELTRALGRPRQMRPRWQREGGGDRERARSRELTAELEARSSEQAALSTELAAARAEAHRLSQEVEAITGRNAALAIWPRSSSQAR